jgi:hypothetical protein
MQRKLDEIDPDDPLDRLITLPKCKHAFTVETLDGVCGLKDWYTFDEEQQRWTGLSVPDSGLQVPVCPTCRAPVTSPRYGRTFKAADLDILEKNVVTKMTQGLRGIQTDLETIDIAALGNTIAEALKQVPSISPSFIDQQTMQTLAKDRVSVFNQTPRSDPIHANNFNNDKLFLFSPETSHVWKSHIRPIIKLLKDLSKVTQVRPAHVHAWESAFTYLYNQEIDRVAANVEDAPRSPQENAMRMAALKLGQAHPRADKRFLVEAIWTTVQLRFSLLQLVRKVVETISERPEVFNPDECAMWGQYGSFILRSCDRDSRLTLDIARESQAHRQMTHSHIFVLRSDLEQFRFRLTMVRCFGRLKEQRDDLLLKAQGQWSSAARTIVQTVHEHKANFRNEGPSWQWLAGNFVEPTHLILREWANIEKSLRQETFYEPVSLDEKVAVIKAMDFGKLTPGLVPTSRAVGLTYSLGYTGHWYACRNGHTFVIGEVSIT